MRIHIFFFNSGYKLEHILLQPLASKLSVVLEGEEKKEEEESGQEEGEEELEGEEGEGLQ